MEYLVLNKEQGETLLSPASVVHIETTAKGNVFSLHLTLVSGNSFEFTTDRKGYEELRKIFTTTKSKWLEALDGSNS